MSNYTEFFLNSSASVKAYDLLQISHPSFSQIYYLVRNCRNGVTVALETEASQFFKYYPLQMKGLGADNNLDQILRVQLGDLEDILPTELDAVNAANGFLTKPVVVYRVYRSDDLSAPLYGPITLEILNLAFTRDGCAFEAKAPGVNNNKTGEVYSFDRFPMLRGFV
jgi:hypothetical protein